MKRLLFIIGIVFILFAIACQEDITGPSKNNSLIKSNKTSELFTTQGKFLLGGIVLDPTVPSGQYYELSGTIYYEHGLVSGPEPIAKVLLSLTISAELHNFNGTWNLEIGSIDTLYINEFGFMLEKLFFIPELNRTFCFDFLVTSRNVILSGRCFEFGEEISYF